VPDVLDPWPNDALNGWDLRSSGADGIFDTVDDVIYQLTMSPTYTSGTTIGYSLMEGRCRMESTGLRRRGISRTG